MELLKHLPSALPRSREEQTGVALARIRPRNQCRMTGKNAAIIACWVLAQSAAALLIPPTALPSAARVPRATICMHASGDEAEDALPREPPADALPSEADAARDEALNFFSEHGDESAYFDDEDVPDDQAMADWREVRRLQRMFLTPES